MAWRQRGLVVKSADSEFKSRSDNQPHLFQIAPGSTSWLHLYVAN